MTDLPVRAFSGGVVLEGSPDVESGIELEACDEYDLGRRGGLVLASAPVAWCGLPTGWVAVSRVVPGIEDQVGGDLFIAGVDNTNAYALAVGNRSQAANTLLPAGNAFSVAAPAPLTGGYLMQLVCVPYAVNESLHGTPYRSNALVFLNIGSRESGGSFHGSGLSPGLYRLGLVDLGLAAVVGLVSIDKYDFLGTGPQSEQFAGGTKGKPCYFRGIFKYGPLLCGWGSPATTGFAKNGDNRVMFSNPARPMKFGRDDQAGGVGDRDYRDIDAVIIGAAGEFIRAGLEWRGRAWIGTSRELHWFSGYGVDSIVTDGTRSAHRQNVLGPHCMIEGPDTLLHGVGSQGHWVFDGNEFDLAGRKLVKFNGTSPGFWDLIWTDPAGSSLTVPGKTNQDFVWMLRDDVQQQVWIVIPYCNATTGYGVGTDTVVIKYDVRTGGYSRSVFLGKTLTAGCYIPRDADASEARILAPMAGAYQLARYGNRATAVTPPPLPLGTPVFQVTRTPGGPEGRAITTFSTLTLAWDVGALPLVFNFTVTIDGSPQPTVKVTIGPVAPVAPAAGDVWLDTSGTDAALGVATAGALIPAVAGYVRKVFSWNKWVPLGGGGMKQQRATFAVPLKVAEGARFTLTVTLVSAAGRYQVEAITFDADES